MFGIKKTHNKPNAHLRGVPDIYEYVFFFESRCFTLNLLALFGNSRYVDATTPVIDVNAIGNESILRFNDMYTVRKWDIYIIFHKHPVISLHPSGMISIVY